MASADAVMQRVIRRELIADLKFELVVGAACNGEDLAEKFNIAGFQQVSLVEQTGEAALHGSVIDFFPALSPTPLRVQFDQSKIVRIAAFDPDSQRSLKEIERAVVIPVRESTPLAESSVVQSLAAAIDRIKSRGRDLETPPREIAKITLALKDGVSFPGIELIESIVFASLPCFLDYFSKQGTLVINDQIGVEQALDRTWENIKEREARLSGEHYLIPRKEDLFVPPQQLLQEFASFPRCYIDHLGIFGQESEADRLTIAIRSAGNIEISTKLKTRVGSGAALRPLAAFLNRLRRKGIDIAFVVGSAARAERLQKYLLEINIDAKILSSSGADWVNAPRRAPVAILQGHLSAGCQLPDQKLAFISENEVFFERSYRSTARRRTSLKRLLGSLAQLADGDFVVHADYGIGLYRGLRHMEIEGAESDFLHIEYADSRLYLPVHNIGKIQKFAGADGQSPVIDKLGSTRWIKTKQKVKESVATLAGDLIKLYAARSVVKGWRFDPSGAEDDRFAESFAFDETPDQLKAIQETLRDMADEKPMDRLVCGDVGFGKTEVAMRAAFKCIQHARQVALLVPTTILVEQHKQTFNQRFSELPVKIAAISRFYSAEENRETLHQLAAGAIDIVIGTHRLLSRDVIFKDLGLVIIDEEHRFGVRQKEKLRAIKKQVDVLTLTATPIPRTLHMSLLGIRDISVISTAPQDRRIIRTYIADYDETLIRDSILRELQRGGQCFFVHNRVETIELATSRLRQVVPEARLCFAHGQMSETQLEKIMRRFLNREIDVLVSTTIVESGLDIPNSNTIIIDRADTFGLAQLYQLRGRVGRSDKQAYAYFLVPKSRKLGFEAQKRLKALQALDDLGMGFNLALRDMEIRGAGNLLGKEQSGSVLAVGYELYSRILKEAILDLKGQQPDFKETIDPELKIGLPAYIPEHYIPDISERLVLYQRFAALTDENETDALLEELKDRYGPLEQATFNLVELMSLRCLLRNYGVTRLEYAEPRLTFFFSAAAPVDAEKVISLVQKHPDKYKFRKNLSLSLSLHHLKLKNPSQLFAPAKSLLETIMK